MTGDRPTRLTDQLAFVRSNDAEGEDDFDYEAQLSEPAALDARSAECEGEFHYGTQPSGADVLDSRSDDQTLVVMKAIDAQADRLARLRSQVGNGEMVGTVKRPARIQLEKPRSTDFVRAHPDYEERYPAIEAGRNSFKELFVVDRELCSDFPHLVFDVSLMLGITASGRLFVWWCKLPGVKFNPAAENMLRARQAAQHDWVSVRWNAVAGQHETFVPLGQLPSPKWPSEAFHVLVVQALEGRIIDTPDHPEFQRLVGIIS